MSTEAMTKGGKPEPGLHHDVPFDIYRSWPYPSPSSLKVMEVSSAQYLYELQLQREEDKKPPSDVMSVGSAVDCMWFDGQEAFNRQAAILPTGMKRNKAHTAYKEHLARAAAAGQTLHIKEKDAKRARDIADALEDD